MREGMDWENRAFAVRMSVLNMAQSCPFTVQVPAWQYLGVSGCRAAQRAGMKNRAYRVPCKTAMNETGAILCD